MTSPSDVIRLAKAAGFNADALSTLQDSRCIVVSPDQLSRLITLARNEAFDEAANVVGIASADEANVLRALKEPVQ